MTLPPRLMTAVWLVDQRGFSVIPLEVGGKKPVAKWQAFQLARPSRDNLDAWFTADPNRNLGIVTGAISNVVAVDLDSAEAVAWAEARLPPTEMKTITARGQHWFYQHPGIAISNRAHLQTEQQQLALDVRGDGGYVVAPTSVHESGFVYTRLGSWPPTSALPPFDPAWIASSEPPTAETPPRPDDRATVLSRAREYVLQVPPAIQGHGGDAHTYRLCCKLVRGFALTGDEAWELLRPWNSRCQPPWLESDLREKLSNALRYGDEPVGGRRDAPRPGDPPTDPAPPPDTSASLILQPAYDVMTGAPLLEVVEGLAWQNSITLVPAESGAGKTFLLLDLAGAVAAGLPWHGRQTLAGSVVYLAFEGGLRLRLEALHHIAGRHLDNLYIGEPREPLSPRLVRETEVSSPGELAVAAAIDTLAATLAATGKPAVTLLIVDTVRASLAGSEDHSEAVSAYLRVIRRLMTRLPGVAAILAHHTGWNDGDQGRKRERGSSAWRGNVDSTALLETRPYDRDRGEAELTLRMLKTRDGEDLAPLPLLRQRVDLHRLDRYGRAVTSCIITRDTRSSADVAAEEAAAAEAAQQRADVEMLRFIRDHPTMTAQADIREHLNARAADIGATIARLLTRDWLAHPKKRQPYVVTELGLAVLANAEAEGRF